MRQATLPFYYTLTSKFLTYKNISIPFIYIKAFFFKKITNYFFFVFFYFFFFFFFSYKLFLCHFLSSLAIFTKYQIFFKYVILKLKVFPHRIPKSNELLTFFMINLLVPSAFCRIHALKEVPYK